MFAWTSYCLLPLVTFVIYKWIRHQSSKTLQKSLAEKKRQSRDRRREDLLNLLRPKASIHLTDRKLAEKISHLTGTELLEGLRKKQFTVTQIVLVFALRALKIGQQLNCTTEEFFDQALDIAEKYDRESADRHLLLRGIPISIKDQIDQQGADSSMGLTMRNFRPAPADGLLIRLLKDQGALPGFVRTATLQGMMLPETQSATYGIAMNPFDQRRTVGGSSGGEGALVAAHGSPIGIGTDIGGSIRIPAHFNGIFGLKPTPGRVSYKDVSVPSLRGQSGETNIRPTAGPLARTVDDLVLVMRSFSNEKMWLDDPLLSRQPWREERFQETKRLTIGYYTNDQWFPSAPACQRAVQEAVEALRQQGHTVVPYSPIDVAEGVRLFVAITQADGSKDFIEAFENEPINPLYQPVLQSVYVPNFLRPIAALVMRLMGEDRNAVIVRAIGSKSAHQYFQLIIDMQQYVQRWLDDMKNKHIDLILAPVNGLPAYCHGQSAHLFHSCSYTFLYNVLPFPAGVVPVTVVRDDEQYYEDLQHNPRDRVVVMAKEVCRESAGLPIGVQVIGWPNDDERVLRVMKELEKSIGRDRLPQPKLATQIDIFSD